MGNHHESNRALEETREGDLVWWAYDDELYILLYKGIAMARIYCIKTQGIAQVFLSDIRKAQTDIF